MIELDFEPLRNDLRVAHDKIGGFNFVHLYDADDHDKFMIDEDNIIPLRDYLNKVIEKGKL